MLNGQIEIFEEVFAMKNNKKGKFKFIKSLIIICLAYFLCSSFYSVIVSISNYKSDIAAVQSEIADEKKINKELQEKKVNMHSDESYKDIARKTLGLVQPGDKVYINSKDNN